MPYMKFHENSSWESRIFSCEETDGQVLQS